MAQDSTYSLDEEQLVDLLDRYAELLFSGEDDGEARVEQYGARFPLLSALIVVVRSLYRALVPVRPSVEFVEGLRADLAREQERRLRSTRRWAAVRERALNVSAIVGAVVSVVALLALVARVIGSIVMIVMLISRRRRSAQATA